LASGTSKASRLPGRSTTSARLVIPAEILSKPGRLTPEEFALVKRHAQAGHDIIAGIDFPWPVAEMVLQHHERQDGSGYPFGLMGDDILAGSQIVAVADVVEAMSSHRPYREALGLEAALAEIERGSGLQYSVDAVEACIYLCRRPELLLRPAGIPAVWQLPLIHPIVSHHELVALSDDSASIARLISPDAGVSTPHLVGQVWHRCDTQSRQSPHSDARLPKAKAARRSDGGELSRYLRRASRPTAWRA